MGRNKLKQIALALHNYNEAHGRLPPAVVRDPEGRPLYSWRVLILPYLETDDLYQQFHLDEPWDSPHNQALLSRMPKEFAPPSIPDLKIEPDTTFYQVFVGQETAFEGEKGLCMPEDFPDGTANTLLVVEAEQPVPWTKPADLVYSPDQPLPSLGGIFKSEGRFSLFGPNRAIGFHVALADGSIRFLPRNVSETLLRSLITRNGGEKLGPDW